VHSAHDDHKLEQIEEIFDTYPELPFVLTGDSGQRDPEIYLRAIQANPGRIRLAVIRDVTTGARDTGVASIAREAAAAGVEMLLVEKSSDALAHIQRTMFESAKELTP
jgi:phosphatidate phosphatase APP1